MCIKWPSSRSDGREFQHFAAQPLLQQSKALELILADFYSGQTQTPKMTESRRGINETPSLLCSGLCSRCLKDSTCQFKLKKKRTQLVFFSTWTLWVLGISANAYGFIYLFIFITFIKNVINLFIYLCLFMNYTYAVKKYIFFLSAERLKTKVKCFTFFLYFAFPFCFSLLSPHRDPGNRRVNNY